MKSIVAIVLIAGLGYLTGLYLPWWGFVVVALVIGAVLGTNSIQAFFSGFLGMFLLWGVVAWMKNTDNSGLLGGKIGQLFGHQSATGMVALTAALAGILGGLSAITGYLAREVFIGKTSVRNRNYRSRAKKAYARK
jgi:hypothetical protein